VNAATPSPSSSHRDAVALFRPNRTSSQTKQRKRRQITWTGSFFCFADKDSMKCPTSTERSYLQKSGLGYRKLQLLITDNAEEVRDKICKEYPKLAEGGGYELLRCLPNCRRLEILDCNWDTLSLRACVGGQANIYIRPIQRNLPIDDSVDFLTEQISEPCKNCSALIDVRHLRDHLKICLNPQVGLTANQNTAAVELSDSNNNLPTEKSDTKEEQEGPGFQEVIHYVLDYLDEPAPLVGASQYAQVVTSHTSYLVNMTWKIVV